MKLILSIIKLCVPFSAFLVLVPEITSAQQFTLSECIEKAGQNNTLVKIAKQSLETREKLLESNKNNYLPKVDLLGGYNYIGKPIEVNLQQVKEGIVEGTANQNLNTANTIFQQITGNQLPQSIQDVVYQTSKDLVNAIYPNYNPKISKQSYFLAGLVLRQPIYAGGKIKASQELSAQQVESGNANLASARNLSIYNIALQYIQILYLNAMIEKQQDIVAALQRNEKFAQSLLSADVIPPYQKNWADIARVQGETNLKSLNLEKNNALLTLKDLMGIGLDEPLEITQKISEEMHIPAFLDPTNNTDLKLLESKKSEAKIGLKVSKSFSRPNVFAIANYQFFRKDLPLVTPPWLVGVEFQWTLFDPERKSRNHAAESLVKETDLLIEQKQQAVNLAARVTQNKLISLKEQCETFNASRKQSYTTSEMVEKRMQNSLSSVKDVNDALQLQYETEKLYHTSLVTYNTVLATYFYIIGDAQGITSFVH